MQSLITLLVRPGQVILTSEPQDTTSKTIVLFDLERRPLIKFKQEKPSDKTFLVLGMLDESELATVNPVIPLHGLEFKQFSEFLNKAILYSKTIQPYEPAVFFEISSDTKVAKHIQFVSTLFNSNIIKAD